METPKGSAGDVLWGSGKPCRVSDAEDGGGPLEKVRLRMEMPGAGGVPVSALVPRKALSDIVEGSREVDTHLWIKNHGHGWRDIDVAVQPRQEEQPQRRTGNRTRRVLQKIPGYGRVPLKMTFTGDVN